jgi:thioredoxin 1
MLLEVTDYSFDSTIASGLVIVDFWSPWCGPCNMLNPVIKSLAEHNQDVTIGKLNTAENSAVCHRFGINAIPSILFFKDGNLVKKLLGYYGESVLQKHINDLK